jgi:hypothetical protein
VIKLLKSKEASNVVDIKSWPPTLDTDELPKKKLPGVYRAPTAELVGRRRKRRKGKESGGNSG